MRTRRYEYMRPQEILDEQKNASVAYLPVGPIEWHGWAVPVGADTITAYEVALQAADITGGVVLPPVHCHTHLIREDIKKFGIDPPNCPVPTYFFREEVFTGLIREYVRLLCQHGYKVIAIVSGHMGIGFTDVIQGICKEARELYGVEAFLRQSWEWNPDLPYTQGHATLMETSAVMYCVDDVDLSQLPDREEKICCVDYGIIDKASTDGYVTELNDPRNATKEIGEVIIKKGVADLVTAVNERLKKTEEKE